MPSNTSPDPRPVDLLFPVPFHEDTVVLADHGGEPHVIMKPLVENLGLIWAAQFVKLTEKFASTISMIETVAEDGRLREMTALPLRKLPAWLYSINPNKVAPEIAQKVVRYQEECDEVLWQYWTKGYAARKGVKPPTVTQQLAAHGMLMKLLDKLEKETLAEKRAMLHRQAVALCAMAGVAPPDLDKIGRTEAPAPAPRPCPSEADVTGAIADLQFSTDPARRESAAAVLEDFRAWNTANARKGRLQ